MNINIKAHFDEEKNKHQELAAKAKSEKEKSQKDIAQKTEVKAKLEAEKKKKDALLRQNEEEGLDVAKLKDKLRELDSQIAQADTDIEALKRAEQQSDAIVSRSFQREDLMVSVLKNVYHCEEAVVVERLEDVLALLPVNVTELDKAGRPTKCQIEIARDDARSLSIKPSGKHFWKNFRPENLRWLPNQQQALEPQSQRFNQKEGIRAFFDKGTKQFILSKTTADWRVTRKVQHSYHSREEHVTDEYEDDFSDIAISLASKLDALMPSEKGELDLDKTYKDNLLLAHARSAVVAQTTSTPQLKECDERLTSDEIYQHIKVDWDAFKNCPWSEEVSGVLALLKYHVENGERARFWSGDFENQYGFRLRTRDHDWIVGELFIETSAKVTPPKTLIEVHESDEAEGVVASLGKLFLCVNRDE